MKRRHVFVSVVLLSLFVLVCAANQASTQTTTQVASEGDRIVRLFIPGCV